MKKVLLLAFAVFCFSGMINAQPKPVERTPLPVATTPESYEAKYEGGLFGASIKEKGALKFDDVNERLVFYKAGGKEAFAIPNPSLMTLFPDSKDGVSKSGKVISALPLPGAGLAGLINKNTKYANITFDDPEIDAKGTASFMFEDKDHLMMFIDKLGAKAKMKQRGDAYFRPKTSSPY